MATVNALKTKLRKVLTGRFSGGRDDINHNMKKLLQLFDASDEVVFSHKFAMKARVNVYSLLDLSEHPRGERDVRNNP